MHLCQLRGVKQRRSIFYITKFLYKYVPAIPNLKMSSSNDHIPLWGHYIRRATAPIVITVSIVLSLGLGSYAVLSARKASVPASDAAVAQNVNAVVAQNASIPDGIPQGVDLFAFVGMNNAKSSTLYELSTFDRTLYMRIFEAQDKKDWGQANALIKRVHDPVLVGHVLYDRYIKSDYKASYAELRDWMVQYGDHPDAYKVYQLAQKRRNNDPSALPAPQIAKKLFGSLELSWLTKNARARSDAKTAANRDEAEIRDLVRQVKQRLANDNVTSAYDLLGKSKTSRMLTAVEYDSLLSEIAAQYFYNGKNTVALKIANQAIKRSNKSVPVAHWVAGLASWKNREYSNAARSFERVTQSQSRNPWMLSAGAFWAARSYEKMGKGALSDDWMNEAASYPRTFYGLIAKTRLGSNDTFSWTAPQLTQALITALQEAPSGKRALALLDIGQTALAQQELLQTHPNGNQRLEKALVAVAHHFGLPKLAMRLGNAINQPDGKLYDVALYPMVPWKGDVSTGVDPALINALIRQESKFDANAQNERSGAKGLMQLMPSTAEFVSDKSFSSKDLHNPEVNVALGQRYVRYLLNMPQVKGNLLYLAAAYNAGPGNLAKWQKNMDYNDDPFMFIESIPLTETRAFVERVMTNYWIYGQRLNQDSDTLDALSDEEWPIYQVPEGSLKLASY